MVVFLLIIIFEYLKMKKINKFLLVPVTLLIIVILYILYVLYFYEDTRWNVATPPTPKEVEDYQNKIKNEKNK